MVSNVKNNSLGQITNISSLTNLKRRPARFRIIGYSNLGYPAINVNSTGKPTFIVSTVPYSEFPIDSTTGLPDTDQFASEGGTIPDIKTGNLAFAYNGLFEGAKLSLSKNQGEFHRIIDQSSFASLPSPYDIFSDESEPRNATVYKLLSGCLVVLDGNASTLTTNGVSLFDDPPKRGDTLLQSFAKDLDDDESPSTSYRVGDDVGLKLSTGQILDIALL